MNAYRLLSAVLLAACALSAQAQWQWVDKNGRKVFSDSPPPPDIPPASILRQPGPRGASVAPPPAPAAAAPKLATTDADLEARKKNVEKERADKEKAQTAKLNKERADNCARAKQQLSTLESGVRIRQVNPTTGEAEFMSDDRRASELKRTRDIVAADCV